MYRFPFKVRVSLISSTNLFLLNKEKITKNVLAIKMFYLKQQDNNFLANESSRKKIIDEVQLMMSRIMKYYIAFYDLIYFNWEIKHDLKKEVVEKKRGYFTVCIIAMIKGLAFYNINLIEIAIKIKETKGETIKTKSLVTVLSELDKISFKKAFIFNLLCNENLTAEVEIYCILKDSFKFRVISEKGEIK